MKNQFLRVLVTAISGDLGQAIAKALRLSTMPIYIFGCDINTDSIGKVFVDSYHTVPLAGNATEYVKKIEEMVNEFSIDAIIPSSEAEISVLSKLKTNARFTKKTSIICQDYDWLEAYGDKLKCMQNLQDKVAVASFCDGQDRSSVEKFVRDNGYPIIIKSRKSSGSKSLRVVKNREQFKFYLKEIESPLLQVYLNGDAEEFSIGCFSCEKFSTVIAFRRTFGSVPGISWVAQVSDDSDVLAYAKKIVKVTKLKGSANIQVRKTNKGVFLLEINPRFSSLAAARAICGFNDVGWSLDLALGIPLKPPNDKFKHIKFCRFLNEMIDFGSGFRTISRWNPKIKNESFNNYQIL